MHILKTFKSTQGYLVLGDFNIHYHQIGESTAIDNYANHINGIGYTQVITKPTKTCSSCSSVIDHSYINCASLSVASSLFLQEDILDYLPICVTYQCSPSTNTKRSHCHKITQVGLEFFLEHLNNKPIAPNRLYSNSYNLNKLCNLLNKLTSQHFRKKMQIRKQFKVFIHPWFIPDIPTATKYKNKLDSKYLKSKNPDLYNNEYKKCRNTMTHVKGKCKQK